MVDFEMLPHQIEHLDNTKRELLIEGSAGSGKSIFAIAKTVFYALKYPGARILVGRTTMPALKDTSILETRDLLWKLKIPYQENRTDHIMTFENGSTITFKALDEMEKLRSLNLDFIFIEQSEQISSFDLYNELLLRIGRNGVSQSEEGYAQMLMVCQPEHRGHWLYKRFHEYNDAVTLKDENGEIVTSREEMIDEIKSNREWVHFSYKDNWYLPEENRKVYDRLKYVDEDLYRRYTLGEWIDLSGLIFTNNWDTNVDRTDFDFYCLGVDFGFTNPSAVALVGFYDNEAYVVDELYEKELLNRDLIYKTKEMLFKHNLLPEHLEYCICDAASPEKIKEFVDAGFGAIGGIKDVLEKIQVAKQTRIHISPNCVNTIKEFEEYKWKKDKKTGERVEQPVKINDHLVDAICYVIYAVNGHSSPLQLMDNNYIRKIKVY